MVSLTEWIDIAKCVVAVCGFIGLVVTVGQKIRSDNRAEWWKRYTWAVELTMRKDDDEAFHLGFVHLHLLYRSKLTTRTEKQIINELAIEQVSDNDGGQGREAAHDHTSSERLSSPCMGEACSGNK
ncbi:hypothetical protein ACGE24_01130 [Corynebacterium kroppenstedtii]|uniref:hypothetical protein n=1 Tax=Corynebacterium sp. PCR 32 TaxID=3351342 RepID=UPI00309ACE1C